MAHKTLIGGTAYDVTGGRCLVGGTGYAIQKGRTLIDGTGYDVTFGTPIGSLPEGSVVKLLENNVLAEFYVAKHGYPTANNGRTLLVRKYIYDERQWHTSNVNAYATSAIDAWLNGDYYNLLSANVRGQIAEVSIPYTPGNGNYTVGSLSRKVFLLSVTELGETSHYANTEGSALPIASTLQIATNSGGTAKIQWTRSPITFSTKSSYYLGTNGGPGYSNCSSTYGSRPAFTLPSSFTGYQL